MDENLVLLFKYPLITCKEINKIRHYQGLVLCGSLDVDLDVINDGDASFKVKTRFGKETDEKLSQIKATNIVEFLDKVRAVLGENHQTVAKNQVVAYRKILYEYSEFTRFHLNIKSCNISSDLSTIRVSTLDLRNREHWLEIATETFKPINFDLPEHFSNQIPQKCSNLTDIYTKFRSCIEELQVFFDTMEEIDDNCGVLDPERPMRRDCYRRIYLGQNLSVIVTVDPLHATARPELKFLGPERLVCHYLEKLNQRLYEWNEEGDFLDNLLDILEMEKFPVKPKTDRAVLVDAGECCICFSLRLDDKMPEIICENKSCENFFHVQCLYEWLSSVNSKKILNEIHGQCPNCEKDIACPLPPSAVT